MAGEPPTELSQNLKLEQKALELDAADYRKLFAQWGQLSSDALKARKNILDMEPEESDRMLRMLYRQSAIPEYQCRFQWKKNSVAFWDNRAVQHYACFDYTPDVRRVERVTIKGDTPV